MDRTSSKVVMPASDAAAPVDDSAVVARARGGDRAAFGELVALHEARVYTLALQLCRGRRDDAQELAQEAFLRALQGIAAFRGDAAFTTWIHRIVVNLHLNQSASLAAKARARQLSIGVASGVDDAPGCEPAAAVPAPALQAEQAEERARLHRAFAALDETRRIVVLLRDVEGKSYEEIAALLEVPIGTVRSRLARAREELSRALGGSGFQGPEVAR